MPPKRCCTHCQKIEKRTIKLYVCGACWKTLYCGRACQKSDWKKNHRLTCSKRIIEKSPITSLLLLPQTILSHTLSFLSIDELRWRNSPMAVNREWCVAGEQAPLVYDYTVDRQKCTETESKIASFKDSDDDHFVRNYYHFLRNMHHPGSLSATQCYSRHAQRHAQIRIAELYSRHERFIFRRFSHIQHFKIPKDYCVKNMRHMSLSSLANHIHSLTMECYRIDGAMNHLGLNIHLFMRVFPKLKHIRFDTLWPIVQIYGNAYRLAHEREGSTLNGALAEECESCHRKTFLVMCSRTICPIKNITCKDKHCVECAVQHSHLIVSRDDHTIQFYAPNADTHVCSRMCVVV